MTKVNKLTEAALVAKAKARGYVLKRGDIYGRGYILTLVSSVAFAPGCNKCAFNGRSQSTLRDIDELLDRVPTIAELKAFDTTSATAAPGSESVQ